MHLKSIEIENYKCFWKPQVAMLAHGFNLFVGANNSGKTSMLQALDLELGMNSPHRSSKNLLEYGANPADTSRFAIKLDTDLHEWQRIMRTIVIPFPVTTDVKPSAPPVAKVIDRLLSQPLIGITLESIEGSEAGVIESCLGQSPRFRRSTSDLLSLSLYKKDNSLMGQIGIANVGNNLQGLREQFRKYIYRFSAHRRPAGRCNPSSETNGVIQLDREATNLPYCINHLQSNDAHGHHILCKWVNRVFPDVKWIQAPPLGGGFELKCLPLPPDARREDLALPLADMGTGIGNVIAILYVVLTSRYPQVIAIDEPNSFLHPRALRELLQILSTEGKQHQFILTAHSADVLTAVNPSLITLFDFDGASTTIKQVNGKDITSLRTDLAELGIRMTDLHGRDRVLWVEGQTEEIVMPELLRAFCPEISAGTAVLRVEHTGTFEKKGVDPTEVVKLYKRLTESSALVPPMVAILLDGEAREPLECSRLETTTNGLLRFLEHPMLESYLLIPEAITEVLSEFGEQISIEQVKDTLNKTIKTHSSAPTLNGARVLGEIFSELSEARHEFKKTRDTPRIVSWLLSNRPNDLLELGNFLRNIFGLTPLLMR
ncbi:MAG: AAA family ATPase [Nitrosospira multiformis]|nr:AAA family ATPase [Nitrosospira multiformis]